MWRRHLLSTAISSPLNRTWQLTGCGITTPCPNNRHQLGLEPGLSLAQRLLEKDGGKRHAGSHNTGEELSLVRLVVLLSFLFRSVLPRLPAARSVHHLTLGVTCYTIIRAWRGLGPVFAVCVEFRDELRDSVGMLRQRAQIVFLVRVG